MVSQCKRFLPLPEPSFQKKQKNGESLFYPRLYIPPTYYCWEGQAAPLATKRCGVARATSNELCLRGIGIVLGFLFWKNCVIRLCVRQMAAVAACVLSRMVG
jgi:hypothetical protein